MIFFSSLYQAKAAYSKDFIYLYTENFEAICVYIEYHSIQSPHHALCWEMFVNHTCMYRHFTRGVKVITLFFFSVFLFVFAMGRTCGCWAVCMCVWLCACVCVGYLILMVRVHDKLIIYARCLHVSSMSTVCV